MTRPEREPRSRAPEILVLTELFPPAIGGSAVLLENIYSRVSESLDLAVLTDARLSPPGPSGERRSIRVVHRQIYASRWGLFGPRALAHHARVAVMVRGLSSRRRTVVHCGRALPEGVAALFARRLAGARYACWTHGEDIATALTSRELALTTRLVYRGAQLAFANSRNTAALLESIGVPRAKIRVVYPGVDPARFHPEVDGTRIRRRWARDDEVVVLSVGRLQRRKGHDLAIEAIARLRDAVPRIRYVIVGDGAERARLESLAQEHGAADRVVFAGEVPGEDLPACFAASDIFLLPNRIDGTDIEGFGIVFLEAGACGKPVIGGRSGGVPEAVSEGVSGLLVSGTDAAELAVAIGDLARSSELRLRMGTAARDRILEGFTWEKSASAVLAAHHEMTQAQ